MRRFAILIQLFVCSNLLNGSENQRSKIGINVLGAVNDEGRYYFCESDALLLNAIASADGLAKWAMENSIIVRREEKEGFKMIKVDYKGILSGKLRDIPLRKNDTIYIPVGIL